MIIINTFKPKPPSQPTPVFYSDQANPALFPLQLRKTTVTSNSRCIRMEYTYLGSRCNYARLQFQDQSRCNYAWNDLIWDPAVITHGSTVAPYHRGLSLPFIRELQSRDSYNFATLLR